MWINAKDFDEAYDKIYENAREVIEEFLNGEKMYITISYGYPITYMNNNHLEEDVMFLGEFKLYWSDFVEELGSYELLGFLREICKEK